MSPVALLAATLLLCLVGYGPGLEQPGHAPRLAVLLCGVPLVWCAHSLRGRTAIPRVPLVLAGLVVASAAIGILLAPPAERWAVGFDAFVLAAVISLALLATTLGSDERAVVGTWVSIGLLPVSLLVLIEAWTGLTIPGIATVRPPAALLVNRNVAAELMVVAAPLAWDTMRRGHGRLIRSLGALAAGSAVATLLTTRSRAGWGAALVGWGLVALVGWWHVGTTRRPSRAKPTWAEVCALALCALALVLPVRGSQPLPSAWRTVQLAGKPLEGSGAVRLSLARNTITMITDHPLLGVGVGRWGTVYPLYHRRAAIDPLFSLENQPERAENDWLEIAAECGVPAALALVALIVGGAWRALRQHDFAAAASCVAVTLHALLAFPLHSPASAAIALYAVGLGWGTGPMAGPGGPPALARRGRWSRVSSPILVSVSGLAAFCGLAVGVLTITAQAMTLRASANPDALAPSLIRRIAPWARREIGLTAAAAATRERDPLRSLQFLEPALAVNPNNLNLLLTTSGRRLKAGDAAGAVSLARRAIAIDPTLGRGWLLLAMAHDAVGNRAEAASACREALRYYRDGPEAAQVCSEGAGTPR